MYIYIHTPIYTYIHTYIYIYVTEEITSIYMLHTNIKSYHYTGMKLHCVFECNTYESKS